jgi:hypothetical protein
MQLMQFWCKLTANYAAPAEGRSGRFLFSDPDTAILGTSDPFA